MKSRFKVGDHLRWNSEAGHKGYTPHASPHDPQYEIQSDRTDHIAMHKGSALRKVR